MQTNLHFNFEKQCYGRTLYSKSHAFAKKDQPRWNLVPVSLPKKANEQRYSIKPPTEGKDFAVKSPPIARSPAPPPPPHGDTLIGA